MTDMLGCKLAVAASEELLLRLLLYAHGVNLDTH